MQDEINFKMIERLSSYEFHLGIFNSTIVVPLSDDLSVNSADYLYMLENGSPLNNIVAKRPIEKTWLLMKEIILDYYDRCLRGIIEYGWQRDHIETRLVDCANRLKLTLQSQINDAIQKDIKCYLYLAGRKIN